MRVLHRWLQRYTSFTFAPEVLAEKLGMLGLEIEGIEHLGSKFDGFIVGRVESVDRHPNADKLTVCGVNVGKSLLTIVCGAPNVAVGQKVAVGLPGALVPRNHHEASGKPLALSRATIRGIVSEGMLCSPYELGISDDAAGILELDKKAAPGVSLASFLGLDDVAYDVEVTPNRPDWLSHMGIAREIGILTGKGLKIPPVRIRESGTSARKHISVTIEDRDNCGRFAVRVIRGVAIGLSPQWLQRALQGIRLRPINNIVDVTNYVMMETGQPLHAFDADTIQGKSLFIRQRKSSGEFLVLDGKRHLLPEGTLMVCDAEREISIAGVMGGANSQVGESTINVIVEAASWNASSIRRTSRSIGVTTDASYRFERGVDPNGVIYALNRAAQLMQETAGGEIQRGTVDVRSRAFKEPVVPLRVKKVNAVLGTSLRKGEVNRLLKPLGIRAASEKRGAVYYQIPTFRPDLTREVDLIEEVARSYGYDRIDERSTAEITMSQHPSAQSPTESIRSVLVGIGFQEAITMPLQDARRAGLVGSNPIQVRNAQSKELDTLRTSLVPGLLSVVGGNHRHGNTDLRLFEIGRVFSRDSSGKPPLIEDFREEERFCMVMSGKGTLTHWDSEPRAVDMFDIKGEIEGLLHRSALDKSRFIYYSTSNSLVDDAIGIEINGASAGYLGSVRGNILSSFGIGIPVLVSELKAGVFSRSQDRKYVLFSRYPKVRRDVAFIVEQSIPSERIAELLWKSSTGLITSVELFDLYQGEGLPPGKKSLAFSVELTPKERTLTDQEIDREISLVVGEVGRKSGATLRSS